MINWKKLLNLSSAKNDKIIAWYASSFLILGVFLKLTTELLEHKNFKSFDEPILQFIANHIRTPALHGTAVDITALGSPALISIFTIIGLVSLLNKKDKMGALFLALNVIVATLWMGVLKTVIARERPTIIPRLIEIDGLSYPSGHSLVSTATYLTLAFLVCRHIQSKALIATVLISTAIIISLISFSRLYLGVHYPSDVFSGMLFGASLVLGMTALFKHFANNRSDSDIQ